MKVAIIGVGRWGVNHTRVCRCLQQEGLCEDLVLCDRDRNRVRQVAKVYGIEKPYVNLEKMLRLEEPDAVIVSTQTVYHKEHALLALSHADVLIEKPMTATLEEARTVIAKAEKEGRILAVGHVERFNPVVSALKKYVKKVGEPLYYITAQRIGPGPSTSMTENLGVAHDLLVHDVDISMYVLGYKPSGVDASAVRTDDFPYECDIHGVFTFPNEARTIASLHASWRSAPTLKMRKLYLQTAEKFITVDYVTQSMRIEGGTSRHAAVEGYAGILRTYEARDLTDQKLLTDTENEPLLLEDRDFLQCVSRRKKPIVDGLAGYNALKCVTSALESAEKGRRVDIRWEG